MPPVMMSGRARPLALLAAAAAALGCARAADAPRRCAPGRAFAYTGPSLVDAPGALDALLAARAPDGELIMLTATDTKDLRRAEKDALLARRATGLTMNLVHNLAALGLRNYAIFSTRLLCPALGALGAHGCVHSDRLATDSNLQLRAWKVEAGDMPLLWAQSWYYLTLAVMRGVSVLKLDADVRLASSPYPVLHGPLLERVALLVQRDGRAPPCAEAAPAGSGAPAQGPGAVGSTLHGLPLCGVAQQSPPPINTGLTYANARAAHARGGGAVRLLNCTWGMFEEKLRRPPPKPTAAHDLVDQTHMRMCSRRVRAPPLKNNFFYLLDAARLRTEPAEGAPRISMAALAARREDVLYAQPLAGRPPRAGEPAPPVEWLAVAPAWLFGRACAVRLRGAGPLMLSERGRARERPLRPKAAGGACPSDAQRALAGALLAAPPPPLPPPPPAAAPLACDVGAAANGSWANGSAHAAALGAVLARADPFDGLAVAVHFVFAKAEKRQLAMQALGWWALGDAEQRAARWSALGGRSACPAREGGSHVAIGLNALLLPGGGGGSLLCADARADEAWGCDCCARVRPFDELSPDERLALGAGITRLTSHGRAAPRKINATKQFELLHGCQSYQDFWDRRARS